MSTKMLCPHTGKVIFFKVKAAKKFIDYMKAKFKDKKRHWYKCEHCGYIHLCKKYPHNRGMNNVEADSQSKT